MQQLVRWYMRSGLRGGTRVTFALARYFEALHAVPITVNHHQRVWVDLRDGLSHQLLAASPWTSVPWETEEQDVMRRLVRPGDTVFDIGAHIGLHTVLLSELIGPAGLLHAFEPNRGKAAALARTMAALPNATLHQWALGDVSAARSLFIPEDESMASLADWTHVRGRGAVRAEDCYVRCLDDLKLPAPDFIKCDVEGHELAVLRGAEATLNQAHAPIVFYEANEDAARGFGMDVSAATDFLRSLPRAQYSIFTISGEPLRQPVATLMAPLGHSNLIAVPAARLSRLGRRRADAHSDALAPHNQTKDAP
jgi:FkbM family methyltransferase